MPLALLDHENAGPKQLREGLAAQARLLGFSRLGVTGPEEPPRHGIFRGWLGRGLAGAMTPWLVRHEPLRRDPASLLPGVRSLVLLATDYVAEPRGLAGSSPDRGLVARYAVGDDYHDLLRERLNRLSAWLDAAAPGSRSRGVVDSAPLSERELAWRAGLGWFGKNTMLIDPQRGSYFLLSALLTTVTLPTDHPLEVDHCGTCTACLEACPTGALPEPRVLDANRCLSSLTIEDHGVVDPALRDGFGQWVFGCDICQDVCPWNRHAPGSADPAFQPRDGMATLSLVELLSLDEGAFRDRFQGSPILRAKRRGLLRSAAIALGNHPAPETAAPGSLETLLARLEDPEPVIRGAAAWALQQWRRRVPRWAATITQAFRGRHAVERDPGVIAELATAVQEPQA